MPGIHHQEDENHEAQQKQQDQCRLVLPNLLEASEDFVEIHVTTIWICPGLMMLSVYQGRAWVSTLQQSAA